MYLRVRGYDKSYICVSGDIVMRSHVFVCQGYEKFMYLCVRGYDKSCICVSGGIGMRSHVFVCQGVSV